MPELVYEEVDSAERAERERVTPMLVEVHASMREASGVGGRPALAFDRERDVGPRVRRSMARWATTEVRPDMPPEEWLTTVCRAGVDVPDEAVQYLA